MAADLEQWQPAAELAAIVGLVLDRQREQAEDVGTFPHRPAL